MSESAYNYKQPGDGGDRKHQTLHLGLGGLIEAKYCIVPGEPSSGPRGPSSQTSKCQAGSLHDLDDPQGLLQHEVPQGPQGLQQGVSESRRAEQEGVSKSREGAGAGAVS